MAEAPPGCNSRREGVLENLHPAQPIDQRHIEAAGRQLAGRFTVRRGGDKTAPGLGETVEIDFYGAALGDEIGLVAPTARPGDLGVAPLLVVPVLFQRHPGLKLAAPPAYADVYHFHGLAALSVRT